MTLFITAMSAMLAFAHAQTDAELVAGGRGTREVVNYGMGYGLQRYSELAQIDKRSVKRLVPVWNYSYGDNHGAEAQPFVRSGKIFVTTWNSTMAVDAKTGKEVWKSSSTIPSDVRSYACCGLVNRGVALYKDKVFRGTMDAHVVAYDQKTGRRIWEWKAADYKQGYTMTAAPLVADGVLITGVSCGTFGGRGFLDGWNPDTGKHLWRTYTIPAPGEPGNETWPGDTWMRGGGATWLTGSFDPDLRLVYWGTGNPSPFNAEVRKGDNLYTDSVLALDPKTGKVQWHYQFTQNDIYDHDGNNELVHATLSIEGKPVKVLMQANKNGFFYVIDRAKGNLLAANAFVRQNWSKGVDMKTGRPVESEVTERLRKGEQVEAWPGEGGGKNWGPMSFNPKTGLAYANTLNTGASFKLTKPEYRLPAAYLGRETRMIYKGPAGILKAIDPLTGKAKWEAPSDLPRWGGTLTTDGGLVFAGRMTGEFEAFDADTGEKLWQFQTGSGIVGQPVTWEDGGTQFVAVSSGLGGAYVANTRDPRLASIPLGGSLWVFALFKP